MTNHRCGIRTMVDGLGTMNLSWRHAALGLVVGALLAGGALALAEWATDAPPAAQEPRTEDAPAGHEMDTDTQCAHMPEHCPPGGSA
jgi:hypothetical protein